MARQFDVNLHNGRVRTISADKWESAGDNWIFMRDGREIAAVSQKVVESITENDGPDPGRRAPKTGAV